MIFKFSQVASSNCIKVSNFATENPILCTKHYLFLQTAMLGVSNYSIPKQNSTESGIDLLSELNY